MSKTTFSNGVIVTSSFLNEFQNCFYNVFDGRFRCTDGENIVFERITTSMSQYDNGIARFKKEFTLLDSMAGGPRKIFKSDGTFAPVGYASSGIPGIVNPDLSYLSGEITAMSDYSGTIPGTIKMTCTGHGIVNPIRIHIVETVANVWGNYLATRISDNEFYITETFVRDSSGWFATHLCLGLYTIRVSGVSSYLADTNHDSVVNRYGSNTYFRQIGLILLDYKNKTVRSFIFNGISYRLDANYNLFSGTFLDGTYLLNYITENYDALKIKVQFQMITLTAFTRVTFQHEALAIYDFIEFESAGTAVHVKSEFDISEMSSNNLEMNVDGDDCSLFLQVREYYFDNYIKWN